MAINLIPLDLNPDKKGEIVNRLSKTFKDSVDARSVQIDQKYTRWMDNYSGKPLEAIRTTPFYRASNFIPQLIRMHTDILSARIFGLVLATKPMWQIISLMEGLKHEDIEDMNQWMEFVSKFALRLPEILDSGIYRAFKTGSCMLKAPWIVDRRWKVQGAESAGGPLKEQEITREFLDVRPLAFDDVWVHPITVQYLRDARTIFHRLRMGREDVDWRKDNKYWDADACAKLLNSPEQSQGTAREAQAAEAGVFLTPDVVRPYTAIEATCDYELQSGKTYEIVVVFNPKVAGADGYLRGYYNPLRKLRHCYGELKPLPREDFVHGYCIPEILEQSQEEQAQIHNQRRDSSTISNTPTFKKRRYADMPNPSTEWYPGKCFELDDMADMEVLNIKTAYNDMIDEEKFLMQLAEQYTGVSAPMQGYGAGVLQGKRGIYSSGATLAMLAVGNQRLDIYLHRMRYTFHDLGNLIYQSYKQFRPDGQEYVAWGEKGNAVKKSFSIEEPTDYPGLFFNIAASDAGANQEVERTGLLLMANTMASYYRQIVEAAATVSQLPKDHPLANVLLTTLDGAKDLASRLLSAFNVGDRKRLLPDVRKILGGGPDGADRAAERVGLPGTDETLSIDKLRGISETLGTISGNGRAAIGGGR